MNSPAPRQLAYAPTPHSYMPSSALHATISLDEVLIGSLVKNLQSDIADFEQEVKLAETAAERDLIDSLAEIYSIVITLDGLEKHYTKDSISENEYTDICNRLLKQYKSILKDETVAREFGDLERFKREWDVGVPLS